MSFKAGPVSKMMSKETLAGQRSKDGAPVDMAHLNVVVIGARRLLARPKDEESLSPLSVDASIAGPIQVAPS